MGPENGLRFIRCLCAAGVGALNRRICHFGRRGRRQLHCIHMPVGNLAAYCSRDGGFRAFVRPGELERPDYVAESGMIELEVGLARMRIDPGADPSKSTALIMALKAGL